MARQIALIRSLELEYWLRGIGTWRFDETLSPGQFQYGEFSLSRLNPRMSYREFESADPIFVAFDAPGAQAVPYTAVCALYARDEFSRTDLAQRYPFWPCHCYPAAVCQQIEAWKCERLVADALLGGARLGELLGCPFAPVAAEAGLAAWAEREVRGLLALDGKAPLLNHILAYARHEPMSTMPTPFMRALCDVGLMLRGVTAARAAAYTNRLRAWSVEHLKCAHDPAFDVRALGALQQFTLAPAQACGLTSLAPIALYNLWLEELMRSKRPDLAELTREVALRASQGFAEEAKQALWLYGCKLHASNCAELYIRAKQQTGEEAPAGSPFPLEADALAAIDAPSEDVPAPAAPPVPEGAAEVVESVAEAAAPAPPAFSASAPEAETRPAEPPAPAAEPPEGVPAAAAPAGRPAKGESGASGRKSKRKPKGKATTEAAQPDLPPNSTGASPSV